MIMINKNELIDLLDEITNPNVEIITSGLRSKALEILKSIKPITDNEKICANCQFTNECRFKNECIDKYCRYFISKSDEL